MKKTFLVLFFIIISSTLLNATLLLSENFDYTAGDNVVDHGWTVYSGSGTGVISVASPGLSYTGYVFSGIGNTSEKIASENYLSLISKVRK